jgi:hypothetical protein
MSGIRGYRCNTCHFESLNLKDLACGHWETCPHYTAAKEARTLPPVQDRPPTDRPYT